MVRISEKFLQEITQLAKEGAPSVDGGGSLFINYNGSVLVEQASAPHDPSVAGDEGLVWVRDSKDLMFTDQDGVDHVVINENNIPSFSKKYTVGPEFSGAEFSTIQAAVDQADADGYSTNFVGGVLIEVYPALYNETVTVPDTMLNYQFKGTGSGVGVFLLGLTLELPNGGVPTWGFSINNIGIRDLTINQDGYGGGEIKSHIFNCNIDGDISVSAPDLDLRFYQCKVYATVARTRVSNSKEIHLEYCTIGGDNSVFDITSDFSRIFGSQIYGNIIFSGERCIMLNNFQEYQGPAVTEDCSIVSFCQGNTFSHNGGGASPYVWIKTGSSNFHDGGNTFTEGQVYPWFDIQAGNRSDRAETDAELRRVTHVSGSPTLTPTQVGGQLKVTIAKDDSGGTVTLPAISDIEPGCTIILKDASGNATDSPWIITGQPGETIDGTSSYNIGSNYESVELQADTVNSVWISSASNISLYKRYTVGPEFSGAEFRTVQGAIDQAVSDGVGGSFGGARFEIYPGFYSESVIIPATLPNFHLVGTGSDNGSYVSNITINLPNTSTHWWSIFNIGFTNMTIDQAVSGSGGFNGRVENCKYYGDIDVTAPDLNIRFYSCRGAGSGSLGTTTVSCARAEFFQCLFYSSATTTVLDLNASVYSRIVGCWFVGIILAQGNTYEMNGCTQYFNTTYAVQDSCTNLSYLENNAFHFTGSVQQYAYLKSGTSLLEEQGNSFSGDIDPPFFNVTGGTILNGNISVGKIYNENSIDLETNSGTISIIGDGYVSGDFDIAGKLTVDGLIDPTGLVLNEQTSAPYDPSITGIEGMVWVHNDGYLIFTDQSNVNTIISEKSIQRESVTYWVDPVSGSDGYDGLTQLTAFQTYAQAHKRIGKIIPKGVKVTVKLLPHPNPEGYDEEEFWDWPIIYGVFELEGVGTNTVAGPFTLQSYLDANSQRLDFGTQGWSPKEFSGYDLEVVNSSTDNFIGLRRTIAYNFADSISVIDNFFFLESEVFSGPVEVGATFNVVSPAVIINAEPNPSTGIWAVEPRKVIGGAGVQKNRTGISQQIGEGILRLQNIEFQIPDGLGIQASSPVFTGSVDMYGIHITSNTSEDIWIEFQDAQISAGKRQAENGQILNYGWGLSTRSRDPITNPKRPRVRFQGTNGNGLSLSTGPIQVAVGSSIYPTESIMADMSGYSSSAPHSAISVVRGGTFYTSSESDQECFYILSVANAYDFEADGGNIEQYCPVQHIGQGHFARSRHVGNITLSGVNPVVHDGTSGTENVNAVMQQTGLHAHYGGKIRLIGWDGSAVLNATAGQTVSVTRDLVENPFSIGDSINGSESSNIYRSG